MSTMSTVEQDHPLAHLIEPLKVADRCDRCGAQAFIAVLVNTEHQEPLRFCGHHGSEYLPALQMTALAIRDDRHLINRTPSPCDDRR